MSRATKAVITLVSIAIAVACWHVLWHRLKNPDSFPIQHIAVTCPCQNLTEPMIQDTIAPLATKGFFGIPLNVLRNNLASLPGVSQVMIHRQWPDTLNVQIQVLQPVARWGAHSLVSNTGVIFPRIQNAWGGLPQISAPDTDAAQAVAVLDLAQKQLFSDQLQVTALSEEPYISWSVQVSNPTQSPFWMILGLDNLPIKLQRFSIAYPALIATQQTLSRVDLRYPNGIAVR